jgi:hypothetical protein
VHRSIVVACNIILDLRSSVLRKKPDMKKRGKILKICVLIKVI